MKKLKRNPGKFETLDLFRALATSEGYKLSDPTSSERFLKRLGEELGKARSSPATLYGLRTQTMFAYVAASMGKCAIVKSEDSGEVHTKDTDIEIPDFRILLIGGQEFFVEVKNFRQKGPFRKYEMKKAYADGLRKYGSLFSKDVKLAVYWLKWNVWTLVPLDRLTCADNNCSLGFEQALKYNEMYLLGDYRIATLPPLRFRIVTNPDKPRKVHKDGKAIFTIGGLELYCDDAKITKPLERNIALFLMLYGEWASESEKAEAEVVDNELIAFEFVSQPENPVPEQPFQMIGSLSGMISRRFNSMVFSNEGKLERIDPDTKGSNIGIQIPEDYKGEALPLWRFIIQPHAD